MLTEQWKKSTKSGGGNGCVETRYVDGTIEVRDSKLGEQSPVLQFNRTEWAAFLGGATEGEFALPE